MTRSWHRCASQPRDLAAQIRSWRIRSGMTLRQLALAAGTSASRLSDYENAKVAPTTDVLGQLGYVAGVQLSIDTETTAMSVMREDSHNTR